MPDGPYEFREYMRDVQDDRRQLRNLIVAAEVVLEELEDRYDGAPDSTTLWMGGLITKLKDALNGQAAAEGQRRARGEDEGEGWWLSNAHT